MSDRVASSHCTLTLEEEVPRFAASGGVDMLAKPRFEEVRMAEFKYVILGGGMVAGYAAKEMRDRGLLHGELAIVSSDSAPPYERPPLSKDFLAGKAAESELLINPRSFYDDAGITLRLATTIHRVDARSKRMFISDGEKIDFEKLLVATGTRVRTLEVPGAELEGLRYLRSLDDARRVRHAYRTGKRAVIVGSGFIGMEVASVLAQQGVETTLVFPEDRVWAKFFTPQISTFFESYYEQHGITLVRGETVVRIDGQSHVESVATSSGRRLPADLVVVGIGVVPATEPLKDSGLTVDDGVVVNEYLETNLPHVWAAGDVARYRDVIFDKHRRAEHWDNAVEQGKHAARALAGERLPFNHVPYFFSDVFDLSYEFWGDNSNADDVIYRGDVSKGSFSAWWLHQGTLVGVFAMKRPDDERDAAPRWIAEHRQLSRGDQLRQSLVTA